MLNMENKNWLDWSIRYKNSNRRKKNKLDIIDNSPELNKEAYAGNNIILKLFTIHLILFCSPRFEKSFFFKAKYYRTKKFYFIS